MEKNVQKNLNINAPVNKLSYGYVSLNIIKELVNLKVDISWFPIGNIEADQKYHQLLQKCVDNSQSFDYDAPCLRIFHQFSMAESIGRGKRYGWPIFELDSFTKYEAHHLNSLDEIIVCSKWAEDIIWNSTRCMSTKVVPLGYDETVFFPIDTPKNTDTIFLHIGKFEIRKSHDQLVDYFNSSFEGSDNVQLWLMTNNPFLSEQETKEWTNLYLNSKLGSKIKFIPRVDSQDQINYIINKCDYGIFPSRAEGWNLPLLEMMGCGKPSIVTNYSAHKEFCTKDNSYLVEIDELEDAFDGKWFLGKGLTNVGRWAKLGESQRESVIQHLRGCHQLKQNGQEDVKIVNALNTAKDFTWRKSAEKLIKII
jgi:glycosyltransferase involved in cell wall biosynthesis